MSAISAESCLRQQAVERVTGAEEAGAAEEGSGAGLKLGPALLMGSHLDSVPNDDMEAAALVGRHALQYCATSEAFSVPQDRRRGAAGRLSSCGARR